MPNTSRRFQFKNAQGETLSGRLESSDQDSHRCAIFAHCFTCSKNSAAATRISKALTDYGLKVLRFDFTGLGNSEGDFANTNFSSSVSDLLLAVKALENEGLSVEALIGHSMGGAAALAAAGQVPSCKAVVTLGAPSDPKLVTELLGGKVEDIERSGQANVVLAGRSFTIKKQFLDDVKTVELKEKIRQLRLPILILHSPTDNIVSINHAREIYLAARTSKSFISLDGADHLLQDPNDARFAASMIGPWLARYISTEHAPTNRPEEDRDNI